MLSVRRRRQLIGGSLAEARPGASLLARGQHAQHVLAQKLFTSARVARPVASTPNGPLLVFGQTPMFFYLLGDGV